MKSKATTKLPAPKKILAAGLCIFLLLVNLTCLTAKPSSARQTSQTQPVTVNGTVTTLVEGMTLPGVNVIEKGTMHGTVTDINGNYRITVSGPEAVITFSFIGYAMQEVVVGTRTRIDISMVEEMTQIEGVVVVGYGVQKKESVIGSIVQTRGEDLLRTGNVPSVSEALAGMMPGVTTMLDAGVPGGPPANILIRGRSTWAESAPLFLVDGIERDYNNIDINEIESISVLKDASATAVFGVKAANGVVLITTKKGMIGKPQINYSSSFGVKHPTIDTDFYVPMEQTLQLYNQAALNDRTYSLMKPQSLIDAWADPNRDPRLYTFTDWVKQLYGQGYAHQHNLNIRGGSDFVRYFTSFGYNYDGDLLQIEKQPLYDPRTYNQRYNYRINLDFQLTNSTVFGVDVSGDINRWNGNAPVERTSVEGVPTGVGTAAADRLRIMTFWPQIGSPIQFENGLWGIDRGINTNNNYVVLMQMAGSQLIRTNQLYSNFSLNQDLSFITEGLRAKGNFSYGTDFSYHQEIGGSDELVAQYYYDPVADIYVQQSARLDPDAPDFTPPRVGNESLRNFRRNVYYELSMNYDKRINKHEIGLLGLFLRRQNTRRVDFPSYEESWVGRGTYNYDMRYFFEFNGAYNGSEKFAPGLRFGFFPSVAVGWIVTNESFMQDRFDKLSLLKFRYSYGEVGSDRSAQRFTYESLFFSRDDQAHTVYFGDPLIRWVSPGPLYYEGHPANPFATWERAKKHNLGIETGFLNNMLTLNVDFFEEKRDQILMTRRAIPWWFGTQSNPDANIGAAKNHGFDVELNWRHRVNTKLYYWVQGLLSISENRIVFRDDLPLTAEYQKLAGKPIGTIRGHISDGYLNSWEDVFNWTPSSYAPNTPGDFKYIDYNADGVIDQFDNAPILNPSYPTKSFSFSLGTTYRQFSVVARFNGMFDISKNLANAVLFPESSRNENYGWIINRFMTDSWTPENLNASRPVLHIVDSHNSQANQYTIRKSDFLRLRTVEISYMLDDNTIRKLNVVKKLEIYANGNNLYTWSSLPKLADPEAANLNVYPLVRRFNLGLRASF
jgi:TonB-linked SusC/RagA family outer membrane protein